MPYLVQSVIDSTRYMGTLYCTPFTIKGHLMHVHDQLATELQMCAGKSAYVHKLYNT